MSAVGISGLQAGEDVNVWGRESFGMAISMEPYAQRMFAKDCTNAADDLI